MSSKHFDHDLSGPGWRARVVADINTAVEVNTGRSGASTSSEATSTRHITQDTRAKGESMSENAPQGLSDAELAEQDGEQLPDREQMSLINANVAAPVNAAVALNALSDGSTAYASATQTAPITQTN